jgi:hypothetical protein
VVPALTSFLFWFLSRVVLIATLPIQWVQLARRRLFSAERPVPRLQEEAAELVFRYPGTNQAMHRANRAAHWRAYAELLKKAAYPPAYYARVLEPDPDGIVLIQYWFCYYYDDWANEHQGDWEHAVILVRAGVPLAVAASQHEAGEYREWADIETRGDHPVLYVAAGSHALYFTPGIHVTTRQVGDLQFSSVDAGLIGAQVMDLLDVTPVSPEQVAVLDNAEVVLIPDPDPESGVWGKDEHGRDFSWLNYGGRWGGRAFAAGGASGPRGPAYAGLRWDDPRMWAETVCRSKHRASALRAQ